MTIADIQFFQKRYELCASELPLTTRVSCEIFQQWQDACVLFPFFIECSEGNLWAIETFKINVA